MSIAEKILKSERTDTSKIILLFAVVMENYRQPLGDEAWRLMGQVAGLEQRQAIAFLTGICLGAAEDAAPGERIARWAKETLRGL